MQPSSSRQTAKDGGASSSLSSVLLETFNCPICLEAMRDVHVTHCGHSFCFKCIQQHLQGACSCPSCSKFLSATQIVPNFALDKSIKVLHAVEPLQQNNVVHQLQGLLQVGLGAEVVDQLLSVLQRHKEVMELESKEMQLQMTLQFLVQARAQQELALETKKNHLRRLYRDLHRVNSSKQQAEVMARVKQTVKQSTGSSSHQHLRRPPRTHHPQRTNHHHHHHHPAFRSQSERHPICTIKEEPSSESSLGGSRPPESSALGAGASSSALGAGASSSGRRSTSLTFPAFNSRKRSWRGLSEETMQMEDETEEEGREESAMEAKRHRMSEQFDELSQCYLSMPQTRIFPDPGGAAGPSGAGASSSSFSRMDTSHEGGPPQLPSHHLNSDAEHVLVPELEDSNRRLTIFSKTLEQVTRSSKLTLLSKLPGRPATGGFSNNISSIDFDRDQEFFVTAGASKKIRVFQMSKLMNLAEAQDGGSCCLLDLASRVRLSGCRFSKLSKHEAASSDYEGVVKLWDLQAQKVKLELEEHEKRVWSLDWSAQHANHLLSGSDDAKVKVWDTNLGHSVLSLDIKAIVCSVKYSPECPHYVAVGSADHHVRTFDLRQPLQPLCVFQGHSKAVSYVSFLSNTELASASTDNTLRLWDVAENKLLRTLRGHINEKHFVGLTTNSNYLATGSESNEVFIYHKHVSSPLCTYAFTPLDDAERDFSQFITAICWKENSNTILAANSSGDLNVLELTSR